jgi:NTE family protein
MAWQFGVLAGLARTGIDLSKADLIIGTSSGAVVATRVAQGADVQDLYTAQLDGPGREIPAHMSIGTRGRLGWAMLRSSTPQGFRARAGRLAMTSGTRRQAERRAVLEARLPDLQWPRRRLLVTAVAAETGEFVIFDRNSGIPLLEAVLASGALPGVWPPIEIWGRLWIDGAMRSYANADLALEVDQLVVLAPKSRRLGPIAGVADDLAGLDQDTTVVVVTPDVSARRAIGRNPMDPGRRHLAARAGVVQGAASHADVSAIWPHRANANRPIDLPNRG